MDTLVGGPDADWLTGGSGYDTFLFIVAGIGITPIVPRLTPIRSWTSAPPTTRSLWRDRSWIQLPAKYVEDTIGYGAGYDAAEMHAMSFSTAIRRTRS